MITMHLSVAAVVLAIGVKPRRAADTPERVMFKGHTNAVMVVECAAVEQESPAKPKVKVEFRWLERAPVNGVTEDKGSALPAGTSCR